MDSHLAEFLRFGLDREVFQLSSIRLNFADDARSQIPIWLEGIVQILIDLIVFVGPGSDYEIGPYRRPKNQHCDQYHNQPPIFRVFLSWLVF